MFVRRDVCKHNEAMYPLLFTPVYKDYIWGGNRIPRLYGRETSADVCAESWEVADRPEGMSIVRNGALAGRSLHGLVEEYGSDIVGRGRKTAVFPLLIKIIDAARKLSVQVHPDDESAARYGGEAKTEMWYVLDAEPGARVFVGLTPGTGPAQFREAVEKARLEEVLKPLPVRPGDAVFVPGGRVHAIGEGCLLLEVQQNSNTTYRVYDWGRNGRDGKPRSLHIEEALRVIRWRDAHPSLAEPAKAASLNGVLLQRILACAYFVVERIDLAARGLFRNSGAGFHTLFVESGTVAIEGGGVSEALSRGTSCLLPAALELYTIEPAQGKAAVIRTSLPE